MTLVLKVFNSGMSSKAGVCVNLCETGNLTIYFCLEQSQAVSLRHNFFLRKHQRKVALL